MPLKVSLLAGFLLLALSACKFMGRYPHPSELSGQTETDEFFYMSYSCDCAQWMPRSVSDSLRQLGLEVGDEYPVYLEAAANGIDFLEDLGCCGNRFRLRGQYYLDRGYPLNYSSPEGPEPARVFRYESVEPVFPITYYPQGGDSTLPETIDINSSAEWQAFLTGKTQ